MAHTNKNCSINFYNYEYLNKIFDDYKCIEVVYNEDIKGYYIKMRCSICNKIIYLNSYNIENYTLNHSASRCSTNYYENFVGSNIGDLKILKYIDCNIKASFEVMCLVCGRKFNLTLESILNNIYIHKERCVYLTKGVYSKELINRFKGIKSRCGNPLYKEYLNIKCEYESSIDFHDDFIDEFINHCKTYGIKNSTIDRINPKLNYSKDNIRIANRTVQSVNTRRMVYFIMKDIYTNILYLSNDSMKFGKTFNINGRSVGNCVRGTSKTCGEYRFTCIKVFDRSFTVEDILKEYNIKDFILTGVDLYD